MSGLEIHDLSAAIPNKLSTERRAQIIRGLVDCNSARVVAERASALWFKWMLLTLKNIGDAPAVAESSR